MMGFTIFSICFAIAFAAFMGCAFGRQALAKKLIKKETMSVDELKLNCFVPEKNNVLFWVCFIAYCVTLMFIIVVNLNQVWRDRMDKYDKGLIVKEITYKTKKINGIVTKTDSTYTYKFKK